MTDGPAVLSGPRVPVFRGASTCDAELARATQLAPDRPAWDRLIYNVLVEWGRNPALAEDEGILPPTLDAIDLACYIALSWRDLGLAAPSRIVPDGDGGVAFERVDGTTAYELNIRSDLSVELLIFDDCRLTSRHRLDL